MSNVIKKVFTNVAFKAATSDSPNGGFDIILSTPSEDRDGDELLTSEWELPLPDHITMDIDHGMSVATTVGSGVPTINADGNLAVSGTFASTELAQQTRALVNEGHIRTVSVAFLVKTTTNPDGSKTIKRELLNGAFVAIPANPEAIVTDSKSLVVELDEKAIKAKKKSIIGSLEAIQDRLNDALEDAYPNAWPVLRGTMPGKDGGTAIFDLWDRSSWDCQTYTQDFTDDGSLVTLVGEPTPVDIVEIVIPDADADIDPNLTTTAVETAAAEKSAAAVSTADDDDAVSVRAKAIAITAEAILNSH